MDMLLPEPHWYYGPLIPLGVYLVILVAIWVTDRLVDDDDVHSGGIP